MPVRLQLRHACTDDTDCCELQAGTARHICSFQRVTCALLHLITLPVMMNSLLSQCYNPILETLADNLDFQSVSQCVHSLAAQASISDPNYRADFQVKIGF